MLRARQSQLVQELGVKRRDNDAKQKMVDDLVPFFLSRCGAEMVEYEDGRDERSEPWFDREYQTLTDD